MLKIVIDTNLLIDGSSDDYNYANRIIDEVLAGKLEAFANRGTIAENRLIANRKVTDEAYRLKLNEFFDSIREVEMVTRLDVVEDYEDNKILSSAVDSSAEYLVTSDNHLLKLENYGEVKIVTPGEFWRIYQEESGSGWRNWLNEFIN